MGRQKSTQKRPQVGPKSGQNYQNIDAGRPQNHENYKKTSFLRGQFFDDFRDSRKIGKRGPNQRKQ